MRRALRGILTGALFAAIGVALSLGASIVYIGYLYTPYGELTYLLVREPNSLVNGASYNRENAASAAKETARQVSAWALSNNATVLFSADDGGFVAHLGVVDGSGLVEQELGLADFAAEDCAGAYVRAEKSVTDAYVRDGKLLSGIVDLPVLGTFEPTWDLPILKNALFIYPLGSCRVSGGLLFTDAQATDGLEALLRERGLAVTVYKRPLSQALAQLSQRLFEGNAFDRALAVTIAGVASCLWVVVMGSYRAHARRLWIHHLFGLSLRRMVCVGTLCCVVLSALCAGLATALVLLGQCAIPSSEFLVVYLVALGPTMLCGTLANLAGVFWMSRHLSFRGVCS